MRQAVLKPFIICRLLGEIFWNAPRQLSDSKTFRRNKCWNLRSNGYFIIEFDNKWSLWVLYFAAEAFLKGLLHMSADALREARLYFQTGIEEWVHVDEASRVRYSVPIRSVSIRKVEQELVKYHMIPNGIHGINIVTSIFATKIMEDSRSGKLATFVRVAGKIDRLLCKLSLFNGLGASAIIAGSKLSQN